MLQKPDNAPRHRETFASPARRPESSWPALVERLANLGFDLPAPLAGGQQMAGGVSLRVKVGDTLQSDQALSALAADVADLLRQKLPVMLSLCGLGSGEAAYANLQRFCEGLQSGNAALGVAGTHLGLCIDASALPLQAFQVLSSIVPGHGPRCAWLGKRQMVPQCSTLVRADAARDWAVLWRDRLGPRPLLPVYGSAVRTACSLLSDEAARSVLPAGAIPVPAASAWLPLTLPLPAFADERGNLDWDRLSACLAEGLALADSLLDHLQWLHPLQRIDACLNRRLALSPSGLGELVVRRGHDPRDLSCLKWLFRVVARIRQVAWAGSRQLAKQRGHVPALHDADPSKDWPDHACREDWQRRWQEALGKAAVRHRNLLVLSPYSVLPQGARAGDGYADLLPVIGCADAWSFAAAPRFRHWSCAEFSTFHRRAWAVMQQPIAAPAVAAGV